MVSNIPDGLRHLRNYAKKKRDDNLLLRIASLGGGVNAA